MRRICCCFGVISLHCAVQAALRQICVSSRSVLHRRQSLTSFCSCHSDSVTSERWSSLTSVCHFNYREVTQPGNYIKQVKFHCWVCRQILTLCFQQPSSRTCDLSSAGPGGLCMPATLCWPRHKCGHVQVFMTANEPGFLVSELSLRHCEFRKYRAATGQVINQLFQCNCT